MQKWEAALSWSRATSRGREKSSRILALHKRIAIVFLLLFVLSLLGSYSTGLPAPTTPAVFVLTVVLLLPGIVLHEAGQVDHRDAALTLPWILLLSALIRSFALIAARFEFRLQDSSLAAADNALGLSTPAVMAWAASHGLAEPLARTYGLLQWMMLAAVFVPVVFGRARTAEKFLLSNCFALILSIPLFVFLPAIGPWVTFRFSPDLTQQACESAVTAVRSAPINLDFGASICFPSFHVIWALLSARALSDGVWLRAPAIILSALIILSTITTGWHYVVDCLSGICVAVFSIALASRYP